MPGSGEVIDGAMQQAPQRSRQAGRCMRRLTDPGRIRQWCERDGMRNMPCPQASARSVEGRRPEDRIAHVAGDGSGMQRAARDVLDDGVRHEARAVAGDRAVVLADADAAGASPMTQLPISG
jgi:hypothetical protein